MFINMGLFKNFTIITLFGTIAVAPLHASETGQWKAYMAYRDVQDVEKVGNIIYVQASNNLYVYNKNDESIQTYDKTNGLNDCNITHISYNTASKRLVIVYSDYNIDFMDANGNVTNLSSYYNATTTGSKTINYICNAGKYAYLSTGFGIIKVNTADAEIQDTYDLGMNIQWCSITNSNTLNAYSSEGKYSCSMAKNLLDKNNWEKTGEYEGAPVVDKSETINEVAKLSPGGPAYNYFGFLRFKNNKLYTGSGGLVYGADLDRKGTVQVLDGNGDWQVYDDEVESKTGWLYRDIMSVDVDPKDDKHVFAAGRTGVYEFNDGTLVKAHNNDNTNGVIQTASTVGNNDKTYAIVNAMTYTQDGTLWAFNCIAPSSSLISYTPSAGWISHQKSELMLYSDRSLENVNCMTEDSRKLLWFCNNTWREPCVAVYQPSTGGVNKFNKFVNQDGTTVDPSSGVRCVAEDLDNNIWIGTSAGPLMIKASETTSSSPVFQQIKVPRNDGTNLADYLLSGVPITCMAVDGAGRKWFGTTSNGVYLISEDNYTQIHHFTIENSSLLSDEVESIAINPETGEVFIGTANGLCSYMSDATKAEDNMTDDSVWAYPNPVKPDYTGYITIKGLSLDADVKIVTSNGMLVSEGRSNGGSYYWDGCDKNGKRVASGIYMVETATSTGGKGAVCKIAIVR